MITINGKVFRNLEEQVAYLSEVMPLFEFDNGKLVIKLADGTLIVRLEVNDIKDISVNTINDIATLTMTYNDGTTTTQTINMTSYLKKITGTSTQDIAYVKLADGTQSSMPIDDQLRPLAIVKRNANGGINCSTPIYDNNGANKIYVDDSITNNILLENIKDHNGNKRFIEGNITPNEISGIEYTYAKWSLSGTHLMIVLAGKTTSATGFSNDQELSKINLPTWMLNKIYPTYSNVIDMKYLYFRNRETGASAHSGNTQLKKFDTYLSFVNQNAYTITADRDFRIQYDLLIDNE